MEVAMPVGGSAIDCYEDMFKEITRKLYGEDGLPELPSNDRHSASTQDRGLAPIDYDVETPLLKPEEHLTAFNLAALMQNGFPPAGILNAPFQSCKPNFHYEDKWIVSEESIQWTQSKIASYNPAQKLFKCAECDCVGYLHRVTEHWLGTHSNLRAFRCPQCPYESAWARCVRIHLSRQHNVDSEETADILVKNNPVVQEISRYLQTLKTHLEEGQSKSPSQNSTIDETQSVGNPIVNGNSRLNSQNTGVQEQSSVSSNGSKRYNCTYCPYATDRRDLFTRHENIHREEKPFQCYVCQKQFNRADHVKKHFLRMHREHPYDLNRIRRHPPKNSSGLSFYQKFNSSMGAHEILETVSNNVGINGSLSVPNNFNGRTLSNARNNDVPDGKTSNFKNGSFSKSSSKKKGEKRFTCCYCPWSGVDNWCLKRHMNTHLKPFICGLCDYKAARSERLATHVLKVHNKRACSKCTYLADDPLQLATHQQEHHPLEHRSNRNHSSNNVRNSNYPNGSGSLTTFSHAAQIKQHDFNTSSSTFLHQNDRILSTESKGWKSHPPKQHGAARLFSYMEASDGSDPDGDSQCAEDINRVELSHRLQSDFPEAGDAGASPDEIEGEDMELPLFVCATCGCEFEDDRSLETHRYTHRHRAASPAKTDEFRTSPVKWNYRCRLCDSDFPSQRAVMSHMRSHSNLAHNVQQDFGQDKENQNKRSRKQSQPKKVSSPFRKNRDCVNERTAQSNKIAQLTEKHLMKIVKRKRYTCGQCVRSGKYTCSGEYTSSRLCISFSSVGRLALHKHWKHNKNLYCCEHCGISFRHRYQVVLHSSRQHVNRNKQEKSNVPPLKEYFTQNETIPEPHNFLSNGLTHPDILSVATTPKISTSLFDHSFLHNNSGINNHMPLIIPTFPPN